MNRHRSAKNFGAFSLLLIVLVVGMVVAAGVIFVVLKNRQIEVARETEQVEERIAKLEMDIKTAEMRIDQLTNRYAMRDQLRQAGSVLKPIPAAAVETVTPGTPAAGAVALAQP